MDQIARLFTAAMKFMADHGIVILSTTAGGMILGPEGALVAGLLHGAASGLIRSPWWRRFTSMLIANLTILYPFIRDRMHVVDELLETISNLLIRLMQRVGLLQGSQTQPLLATARDDRPPTC